MKNKHLARLRSPFFFFFFVAKFALRQVRMDPQSKHWCKYIQLTHTRPDLWRACSPTHVCVHVHVSCIPTQRWRPGQGWWTDLWFIQSNNRWTLTRLLPPIYWDVSAFRFLIGHLKQQLNTTSAWSYVCYTMFCWMNCIHVGAQLYIHTERGLIWTQQNTVARPKPFIWPWKPSSASWRISCNWLVKNVFPAKHTFCPYKITKTTDVPALMTSQPTQHNQVRQYAGTMKWCKDQLWTKHRSSSRRSTVISVLTNTASLMWWQ